MIADIKVGKAKELKNPKNKYKLYLRLMHGDADSYTSEEEILDKERAIEDWNLLSILFDLLPRWDYLSSFELEDILKVKGAEFGISNPEGILDLIHYDVVYEGRYARPQVMWLTYFDDNGVEHGVDKPKKLGL